MNRRNLSVALVCLFLSAGVDLMFFKFSHGAFMQFAIIYFGYPGLTFAMVVYPGAHGGKLSFGLSVLLANATAYYLLWGCISAIARRLASIMAAKREK